MEGEGEGDGQKGQGARGRAEREAPRRSGTKSVFNNQYQQSHNLPTPTVSLSPKSCSELRGVRVCCGRVGGRAGSVLVLQARIRRCVWPSVRAWGIKDQSEGREAIPRVDHPEARVERSKE